MSLSPESVEPKPVPSEPQRFSRILRVCFVIFTLEIGLFLVLFPWVDSWTPNHLQDITPWLDQIWDNPYFRGAISGLGLVNVYIALLEIGRLFRGR